MTALVKSDTTHQIAPHHSSLNREQIELLKRTIAKGTTDDEFALFLATANRMGLDPFARQIHAVKRFDKRENREVMSIQVGIDGYRTSSMRTAAVDGQEGPFWCGDDGVWVDAWLHDDPPAAARVVVYRKGCARPFVGVATYRSYVQTKSDGKPNSMWSRGPDFMLAKCAEALALRKAFPTELGGTITPEEVGNEDDSPTFAPLPDPQRAPAARRDPTPTQGPGSAAGEVGDAAARERFVKGEPAPEAKPEPAKSGASPDLVKAFGEEMMAAPDAKALAKVAGKIGAANVSDDQRAELLKIFNSCRDALAKAAGK